MEKISVGMLLYHGSYMEIKNIALSECVAGKDFGKGFYLTSSYEQAKNFVRLSVKRNKMLGKLDKKQNFGFVNVYEITDTRNLNGYYFDSANTEWLHFVAGSREQTLFRDEVKRLAGYNVIVGKIANDRTAATLQAYIDGVNGEPGDERVDRITIEALLPNRLEDQYCFKTEDALCALTFIKCEQVDVNG